MNVRRMLPLLLVAFVGYGLVRSVAAEPRAPRPANPNVLLATPAPVLFELALDEIELRWRTIPDGRRSPEISTAGVVGASVLAQRGGRAVITMAGVESAAELRKVATALQGANPGAVVEPVFYEVGVPRTVATRRIGTNAVRLGLETGTTPESVVGASAAGTVCPVAERPGEYALEEADPMAALELTTTLRGRTGLTSVALSAVPDRVLRKSERLPARGPVPRPFDEPEQGRSSLRSSASRWGRPGSPSSATRLPSNRWN